MESAAVMPERCSVHWLKYSQVIATAHVQMPERFAADSGSLQQALAQMFGKAWGYPMLLVASTQEARERALELLESD